jgi:hypothetical protein
MARLGYGGKRCCESCLQIDVRRWHREGKLRPGTIFFPSWIRAGEPAGSIGVEAETDHVILQYQLLTYSERRSIEQLVPITRTACRFGGQRPWFVCSTCGSLAAILYSAGELFSCRRCNGLVYASQQQNPVDRAVSQAQKIRRSLGGNEDLFDSFPEKPKRMHWRTYRRLRDRARVGEDAAEAFTAQLMRSG